MDRYTRVGPLILAVTLLPAQELRFARLGDFRLESGDPIRDCRLGYRTLGRLNADRSNAILFPTWFTGTTQDLLAFAEPGQLVDPARYFVILVDALGNGVSSSPSNSKTQPGRRFPRFTIRDMVRSEYRLVTEVLKLDRLHAVMGISMGGMQTFQWAVEYPDMTLRAVPIVGTPQLTSYDLLLWQAELSALESGRTRAEAMRAVGAIHALALTTPEHRVRETPVDRYPEYLKATARTAFHPENWRRQLQAMMSHDVGSLEAAARRVKARMLVVVGLQDHMVNSRPAIRFANLLRAPTLELNSDCGHMAMSCEKERVYREVREFLEK